MTRERTPPNAEGDFYVEKDICLARMAPHHEAPGLTGYDEETFCHFKRRPATPEETGRAIEAVRRSCVEGLRYAGTDPAILARLRAAGLAHLCDALDKDPT